MSELKKYAVSIKAVEFGSVLVEAMNEAEAKEKAYEAEMDGNAEWGNRDIEIQKVEIY